MKDNETDDSGKFSNAVESDDVCSIGRYCHDPKDSIELNRFTAKLILAQSIILQ
jgi:hypothetical protein